MPAAASVKYQLLCDAELVQVHCSAPFYLFMMSTDLSIAPVLRISTITASWQQQRLQVTALLPVMQLFPLCPALHTPVRHLKLPAMHRQHSHCMHACLLSRAVLMTVACLLRWMAGSQDANWDLAIIYSGNKTQYTCPDCVHVETNKGAKWLLIYGFTQSTAWQNEYQHRYSLVYVPDDDILQTTATINSVFNIHAQHGLLLSQPVLCSWLESHTASWDMIKGPTTVLRYTNFVEIMVPLFSMAVFNSTVINTMSHAETGKL